MKALLDKREGGRKISVYVESGFVEGNKPCVNIGANAFERWDGDPSFSKISPEKQEEMMANFTSAMEFQALAVVVA